MSKNTTYSSVILITGGTVGIGYEAARVIAREHQDSQIVLASRTDKTSAAQSINQETGLSNVSFLALDLSSRAAVRDFATRFKTQYDLPISTLLLNAGVQFMSGTHYTADGVEATFGTNHVGHALLLFLLAPQLTREARILITASGTHDHAQGWKLPAPDLRSAELAAHPDDAMKKAGGQLYYTTSKLANVVWTYALARRMPELGRAWTVNAFDPGLTPATGLARSAPAPLRFVVAHVLPHFLWLLRIVFGNKNVHTPGEAGANLAALASAQRMQGVSGKYWEGEFEDVPSSKESHSVEKQDDLWDWTLRFVAKDDAERLKFARLE